MNIGILIPGFGADGNDWALPVYQNFVRELAKTQDVRVITLRYPHTREPYMYHGAKVYPLGWGAWTKGVNRLRLWWDTWQTIKRLHAEKPFNILHGIWADETGALSGWIGKRLNIPSVVSIAGGELVKERNMKVKYGLQHSMYGRWIVRQALTANTVVVSPYQMWLTYHLEKSGNKPHKVEHIPLGIDREVFYPSDIERKPKHLISVGSLIPVKNQIRLLDTMVMLDDDITLDIIGQGVLENKLKQYAEKLGVSHRVNFLGNVPHTQLREHYSKAQLHVHTSLHEAFGMAVLEAAACGTPTLGTRFGLTADNADLAWWIDDLRHIKDTVHDLFSDEQKLEKFRADALKSVEQHYTIEHMTEQYIALYQSLLKS